MAEATIHYEVLGRRAGAKSWTLELATEDREIALATARDLVAEGVFASAKVTKESLDEATREFRSATLLNVGADENAGSGKSGRALKTLCEHPEDLYNESARERIGRLMRGFLLATRVTPYELVHRPDLARQLDASGSEMLHAIQKIAAPEAAEHGGSVHDLVRKYQILMGRAVARLTHDERDGLLADFAKEPFAAAAERLTQGPDAAYRLGAGVAAALISSSSWDDKVDRLVALAEQLPPAGPARLLAAKALEQPLVEILALEPALESLFGGPLDLGRELAGLTRLANSAYVDLLIAHHDLLAEVMPPLSPGARRLSALFARGEFKELRRSLQQRILRELKSGRRLRPAAPREETTALRALAVSLAADPLFSPAEVETAFAARSKLLMSGDFVDAYLRSCSSADEQVVALMRLAENVIGANAKRTAARWLEGTLKSLRFESEMRDRERPVGARLARLARLQQQILRSGLEASDVERLCAGLGQLGGTIEAEEHVMASLVAAKAPRLQKLLSLLPLAAGETAPTGPAADRARVEVLQLLRDRELRNEIASSPDRMGGVLPLLQRAGITERLKGDTAEAA